jgi:hypothetical protein
MLGSTALQKEIGSYSNYLAQTLVKVHEYEMQHPNAFKPVEDWLVQRDTRISKLYEHHPGLEKTMPQSPAFCFEDYFVSVGMDQDTLTILYGKPTRIQKNPRNSDADEAWVYDYPNGVKWIYFLKHHSVSRIICTYIEG